MAKECFCGCGQQVSRWGAIGAVNTRGAQVRDRLNRMEHELGIPRDVDEETKDWYWQGDQIIWDLEAVVHGHLDPGDVDERWIREWQAMGRRAERSYTQRVAKLGRAVRKSGLSDEEAARAIARGELPLN